MNSYTNYQCTERIIKNVYLTGRPNCTHILHYSYIVQSTTTFIYSFAHEKLYLGKITSYILQNNVIRIYCTLYILHDANIID
jgi:hypothetical protein